MCQRQSVVAGGAAIAARAALLLAAAGLSVSAACGAADTPPAKTNEPQEKKAGGERGKKADPALRIMVRKPLTGELERLGVLGWPIWTHEAGDLPWTYEQTETCYILEGEVTVVAEGQKANLAPGDMVFLPQGLKCVWNIHKAVRKHYSFDLPLPAEEKKAETGRQDVPPGWDTWDAAKRESWERGVEWARHVVAIKSEEAQLKVDKISGNIALVEKAVRKGIEPKVIMDAIVKSLETGKSPQELLREAGVTIDLDK